MNFITRLGMAVCVMSMLAPCAQADDAELPSVLKELETAVQAFSDRCARASTSNEHLLCADGFRLLAVSTAREAQFNPTFADIYTLRAAQYSRKEGRHQTRAFEAFLRAGEVGCDDITPEFAAAIGRDCSQ